MRILVVPDKFKGTLPASEAARAIALGWNRVRPDDPLDLLPMSDGGDGFGEIVGKLLNAERRTAETVNAAHEPLAADWWWDAATRTAVVESARIIGLAMLPPGRFHPYELDTFGLGKVLRLIATEQPGARLIIGIGGSATNDGGFGMARSLGYRFEDSTGHCMDRWVELDRLLHIRPPSIQAHFSDVVIATDVSNPLLGPLGATHVYGPQKGLRPEDLPVSEARLARLADVVDRDLDLDAANEPGTGAAGGLGYGLRVFLGGSFEPGFDIFARLSGLRERIERADLVITAEGCIDAQTAMGKGTGAVLKLAKEAGKPCYGFAGVTNSVPQAKDGSHESTGFDRLLAMAPEFVSLDEARSRPAEHLADLAAHAARELRAK